MKSISSVFCIGFIVLCGTVEQSASDIKKRANTAAQLSTELYNAIGNDNATAVKILLDNGANPNTYYEEHKISALLEAFRNSLYFGGEIIELLIEHGADINVTDEDGQTPLHQAIILGHKHVIEVLIEKGANVNAVQNERKMTPLHFIVIFETSDLGHEKWTEDDFKRYAELLIDHGADVNKTDLYGQTPLFQAIFMGRRKLIELLIEKGSIVNVVENRWKYTPLHLIASMDTSSLDDYHWTEDDQLKMAELLIEHGADLYAKRLCADGYKTPLEMAKLPKMKEFLRSKMT